MPVKDRGQIVLVAVGVVLLVANVFLIVQNIRLRQAVEQSKQFVTDEGYQFSDFKIAGTDGQEEIISFSNEKRKTILLVFSPSCNYCLQQYSDWKELVQNIDHSRWRVLAVTSEKDLDKIKNHIEEQKLIDIKVGAMSPEDIRRTRMLYTPMTLILDGNGVVEKVWAGLWKKGFDLPN